MTRIDKLVAKFVARPPEVSFADVETLLAAFGWYIARQRGSHVHFAKEGVNWIITIPKQGGQMVKRTYVAQICQILQLDDYHGNS